MKKILLVLFSFMSAWCFATHNRAGEILYTRIAPFNTVVAGGITVPVYTYSIIVITYTDDGPNIADRCEDTVYFGDGQRGVARRINSGAGAALNCGCGSLATCGQIIISEFNYRVKKNIYRVIHSYAGAGTYTLRFYDPNRNADVANIPNSVYQPFYVESQLVINSFTGANSSPQFLYDPIDRACVGKCFTHNPGAYDPDGDSLSYEITTCRVNVGQTVPGYTYPDPGPGGEFDINPVTGLVKWCSPQHKAEYNIAFLVKEWRKNTDGIYLMIGYMIRDMQVVVDVCPNNFPPEITLPPDTCVEAGTLIHKKIKVTDPVDPQFPGTISFVTLTGVAGGFSAATPTAVLTNTSAATSTVNGNSFYADFSWQTTCDHVRQQPYLSVFKAKDDGSPFFSNNNIIELTSYSTYIIRVVPPSVKNVTATPAGSTIRLSWQPSTCSPAGNPLTAYKIYRKNDCSPYIPTPCQTGISQSSGFTLIGQALAGTAVFIDDNGGSGLVVGQNYSYIVVAVYADGTQTFGSSQVCARLRRDVPLVLNVDVRSTATGNGSIYVRWTRPLTSTGNFDTLALPGPYTFDLRYRQTGAATDTSVFTTTGNVFLGLDTQFVHTGINTVSSGKQYIIKFMAGTVTVGSSQLASSVFLSTTPADRKVKLAWSATTPWNNTKYTVWRKDPAATSFTAIGSVTGTAYTDSAYVSATDTNIILNGSTYCYKILAEGAYSDPTIFKPLLNYSQEACATAVDLTPPCTPTLNVEADCAVGTVKVTWNDVRTLACGDDVVNYILYYKPTVNDLYTTLLTGTSTVYAYDGVLDSLKLISGCYAIQAVDGNNNISPLSPDFCIDNCPIFELPNVFTPNKDGVNEFFKAIRVRQIQKIDMTVFDRWGDLVYKTTDPYFKWDGISIISKEAVSEGTFFYICDVYEPRLKGIVKRTLKGYVQVLR